MAAPRVRFPIGISDFRMLREGGYRYVDKTAFVDAVVDADAQVLLLPRPRRFGKTLNLSMLRCFLEKRSEPATTPWSCRSAGPRRSTGSRRCSTASERTCASGEAARQAVGR